MDYGGFHEVETDGKIFLVYHQPKFRTIPRIKSPSSSTEAANQDQPLFLRPFVRRLNELQTEDSLASLEDIISIAARVCKLYDDHHVLPLFWCNNEKIDIDGGCGICYDSNSGTDYYFCDYCNLTFHKECVEAPIKIKHPYYPRHSLEPCFITAYNSNCLVCGRKVARLIYRCADSGAHMHPICAMKPIPFVIDQQKIHDHPLSFFPRQSSLICDVCGLVRTKYPTYVCFRCNFVAHKDCMNSPHTINISRHHHRISYLPYLPYGEWPCGVCRQSIDGDYGAYACNKCGDYAVHSRCALGKNVWDGKELQGVPEEEDDITQDAPPLCKISEGVIHYFLHDHHLRLEENILYNENKLCQACVMPIFEDKFYSCTKCDFILHETCLKARRRIQHPLHPHPLTLKAINNDDSGYSMCKACWRICSGFVYECPKKECEFELDVRCASISEPFAYQGHGHPLFLSLDPEEQVLCEVCKLRCNNPLNCIKCNFIVCIKCATVPYKVRYKHDKHFLTLSWGEERYGKYWCDECEDIVKSLFYWCSDCSIILHTDCLFSKDPYVKPGQLYMKMVQVLAKSNTSRPICYNCRKPCQGNICTINNRTTCSILCAVSIT